MHLHSNKYIYYKHMNIFLLLRRDFCIKNPVYRIFDFPLSFPMVCPPLLVNGGGVQYLAVMFQTADQGMVSSICSPALKVCAEADFTYCLKFSFADVHISETRRANFLKIRQHFHHSVSSLRSAMFLKCVHLSRLYQRHKTNFLKAWCVWQLRIVPQILFSDWKWLIGSKERFKKQLKYKGIN